VRVLSLGGGGLRAAFEVPILETLLAEHDYGLIMGISAGAVNGVFAAQGDVGALRPNWEHSEVQRPIAGVPGALALSHRPWQHVYSLGPLNKRLEQGVSLDRLRNEFACGVVVRETREFRLLAASDMTDDRQLRAAILASSSIAGLMPPVAFHGDGRVASLYDGGHRHCVPPIPSARLPEVEHLDVVSCVPLHYTEDDTHPAAHAMVWAFENHAEIAWQLDLDRLMAIHRDRGISVHIYAPAQPLGGMFDARPATIEARIRQGEAALGQPLEL
jgi:predicted acylesterase/phospholipase RssA